MACQRFVGCVVCVGVWLLAGCGGDRAPGDTAASQPSASTASSAVQRRVVAVELTEGTNLAVDVHAASSDRVISLQGSLYLLPGDNTAARALTDAYYDAREPAFSNDGRRVVFQGYRNGNWDLFQLTLDGGAIEPLTDDAFDDREPQYSVDGRQVVFSSDRSGTYDIWMLDVASKRLSQLSHSKSNAHSPAINAQGEVAYTEQSAQRARLIVKGAEDEQVLTEQLGTLAGLEWSPDGSLISYQMLGAQGAQVRIIDVKTTSDVQLSPSGMDVFPFRASWLKADTLVYAANGKVMRQRVTVPTPVDWPFKVSVQLERHNYVRRQRDYDAAVERPALGMAEPVISNDGEHIYFTALGDLWHWQPASKQLINLTDDAAADNSPALSPDGKRLAFVGDRSGEVALHLMTLATGKVKTVKTTGTDVSMPSWSPDGKQLGYFVAVPGNPLGGQLMLHDLATGTAKPVLTPMPAQPISWSADGSRVAVARLNPYSSRYREGMYELLVIKLADQTTSTIAPVPHQSILEAALTVDGGMTYLQGGLLYRLELNKNFTALETTGALTDELTDMPRWSANGEHLVYLSGTRMKRMNGQTGQVEDVTPELTYRLDAPTERYVVRAGQVFTGKQDSYLRDQDIWVEGARIARIVPTAESDAVAQRVKIIEAANKTVVPGLFEMHAHMGVTSEIQGRVWLSYGITTVRDPGSSPYVAKARQEAWDAGRRAGPRTHVTGYLTDGNRVYYSMAEGIVSEDHLQRALNRTRDLELDFVKTYVRLPDHWQKEVVEFAHGLGIPVSSHELYPAVAHGMDHVEHIGGTSRRGYQPKVSRLGFSYQDVIALLSASGMGMTATAVLPGFAVIADEEPDWFETPQFARFYGPQARKGYEVMVARFGSASKDTARANGKLLRALTENDALLVTGTDAPFVPYGAGLHAEFRLYARAGIAPVDILRQATQKSAQAAGVAAELGTLEPGKLADMVIVNGDPLAEIRDLDQVVMTIKNGRRYEVDALLQ